MHYICVSHSAVQLVSCAECSPPFPQSFWAIAFCMGTLRGLEQAESLSSFPDSGPQIGVDRLKIDQSRQHLSVCVKAV